MARKTETVILIPGLWMPGLVMLAHQSRLRRAGFAAQCFSYPSWQGGLADNVRRLSLYLKETPGEVIHLVAHSLGGLVTLKMLSQETDPRIGRIVLMGSPYAGCHCGFSLTKMPFLSRLAGQTFEDWFSLPRPDLPPGAEIGIVAGTHRIGLGRLIPGLAHPNDGLISVDETCLPTASDQIALNVSHSGMLLSHECTAQIVSFLRTGKFVCLQPPAKMF